MPPQQRWRSLAGFSLVVQGVIEEAGVSRHRKNEVEGQWIRFKKTMIRASLFNMVTCWSEI